MKLRDHPRVKNWPPVWTQTAHGSTKTVRGEFGVLQYVHANPELSGKCYLVVDYEGETYVGTLIFESHAFCEQFIHLLRSQMNRSIKEIGDLEIPPQ